MEVYLQDTYGVIVYQEQIMKMAQAIGGFTPGQSDMLRKVIVRGAESTLCALEMKFMEGGLKNGYKKSDIKKVWREMRLKGKNSFNKSHAVCYTLIGYQMGYLKTHFPEVFKKVMDEYGS
jgi:DNA polymerase-3 subunit alpha